MRSGDRRQFAEMMDALAATFRTELSEILFEAYWRALEPLSIEDMATATNKALGECTFFPKPVELRRLAGEITPEDRAVHAWEALREAVGSVGSYQSVDFDDPLVNATVRNLGGWAKLCQARAEDFGVWVRKDFERIYVTMCTSGATAEACAYLPGVTERERIGDGYDLDPVRTVKVGLPKHQQGLVRGQDMRVLTEESGGELIDLVTAKRRMP